MPRSRWRRSRSSPHVHADDSASALGTSLGRALGQLFVLRTAPTLPLLLDRLMLDVKLLPDSLPADVLQTLLEPAGSALAALRVGYPPETGLLP